MGGKNHQPCRSYLLNSTKLSRAMSVAFVSLELANIALEDVILSELAGEGGEITHIVSHLTHSGDNLKLMKIILADLRGQMEETSFTDLPSLKTTNLRALGALFATEKLHSSAADWQTAAECMEKYGFWGMLDIIDDQINGLLNLNTSLKLKIGECEASAKQGALNLVLEENQALNFKPEFARLYTAWASFQQLFLASSLISTELWYSFNNFGTLLEQPKETRAAA